jgi:hypothetical protein
MPGQYAPSSWGEIISQAAVSPLGITALVILVVGFVMLALVRRDDKVGARVTTILLLLLFCGGLVFAAFYNVQPAPHPENTAAARPNPIAPPPPDPVPKQTTNVQPAPHPETTAAAPPNPIASPTPAPAPPTKTDPVPKRTTFTEPTYDFGGPTTYADACNFKNAECGQSAADAFCRYENYSRAVSFSTALAGFSRNTYRQGERSIYYGGGDGTVRHYLIDVICQQ